MDENKLTLETESVTENTNVTSEELESYQKTKKYMMVVLSTIVGVFMITLCIYLATLYQYQKPHKQPKPVSENKTTEQTNDKTTEEVVVEESVKKDVATNDIETETHTVKKPETDIDVANTETTDTSKSEPPAIITPEKTMDDQQNEDVIPEKEIQEDTDDETASVEKTEVSKFQKDILAKWESEMSEAKKVYLSDNTYVSVTDAKLHGETYTIAHAIVSKPEQVQTVITEKRSITRLNEYNPYILAFTGSKYYDYNTFYNGLHIYDYDQYGVDSVANGEELMFTKTGHMKQGTKGTSMADYKKESIAWSIVTDKPLLIEDGKATKVTENLPSRRSCKLAVGMVKPNEYYVVAASDGDYLSGITYEDLQDIFMEKSCTFAQAINTELHTLLGFQGKLMNLPPEEYGKLQREFIIITDPDYK